MLPLIFFILGLITMGFLFPTLESIVSWFQQWVETKKAALIVKQMNSQKELQDMQEPAYETPVVGSQVNYDEPEEAYPEEETEPDED